jgi:DNA repair protein RadA/Sms
MPPAIKTIFTCSNCDAQFPKWSGRCLECGSWGTLSEEILDDKQHKAADLKKVGAAKIIDLSTIKTDALSRLKTGLAEVDRVLGWRLSAWFSWYC